MSLRVIITVSRIEFAISAIWRVDSAISFTAWESDRAIPRAPYPPQAGARLVSQPPAPAGSGPLPVVDANASAYISFQSEPLLFNQGLAEQNGPMPQIPHISPIDM